MNADTRPHARAALLAMILGDRRATQDALSAARANCHSSREAIPPKPGHSDCRGATVIITDTDTAGVLLRAQTDFTAGRVAEAMRPLAKLVLGEGP